MVSEKRRLIDAYTLAEEIESLTITVAGKPAKWNDAKHSILRILAEQPDVDAVEVVHGRWIEHPNVEIVDGKPISNYECSECCCFYRTHENYCGFCGAQMDGERKDNG